MNADSEAADGSRNGWGLGGAGHRGERRAEFEAPHVGFGSVLASVWTAWGVKTPMLSRATVEHLWQAGLADARRSTHHPDWRQATEHHDGMRVFNFTR